VTAATATAALPDGQGDRPLLRLDDVNTFYVHIHALQGITLEVYPGEIVTLLGGNGAGKTTTLRTISGLIHPRSGTITLDGDDITHVPAHKLVHRGVAHAPEGRRIFGRMTVLENLQMGAYTRTDKGELEATRPRLRAVPAASPTAGPAGGTLSAASSRCWRSGGP